MDLDTFSLCFLYITLSFSTAIFIEIVYIMVNWVHDKEIETRLLFKYRLTRWIFFPIFLVIPGVDNEMPETNAIIGYSSMLISSSFLVVVCALTWKISVPIIIIVIIAHILRYFNRKRRKLNNDG